MSLSYIGVGARVSFAATANITVPIVAGTVVDDLILICVAVENAAAGSDPLVDSDLSGGWTRIVSRRPAAVGSGVEVWGAHWGSGGVTNLALHGSYTGVAYELCYRCTGGQLGQVIATDNAQWAGSDPVWPSVDASAANDVFLAVGADTLSGAGFAFPVGWTTRDDFARNGVFGNVELVAKDITVAAGGPYGTVATVAPVTPVGAEGSLLSLMLSCGDGPVVQGRGSLPLLGVG